jgi:hypothetical protein
MENEIDVSEKLSQFNQIFSDFKNKISELLKDWEVDVNDWGFSLESHKNDTTVDISVKMVIKHKEKKVDSKSGDLSENV